MTNIAVEIEHVKVIPAERRPLMDRENIMSHEIFSNSQIFNRDVQGNSALKENILYIIFLFIRISKK